MSDKLLQFPSRNFNASGGFYRFEPTHWITGVCFVTLAIFGATHCHGIEPVSFSRDVRPILSQNCFKCHGPDEQTREGGLRLDEFDSATLPADSGISAIVAGSIEESELIRRIDAHEDELMPPASSNLTLSAAQKSILKRWIAEGAKYETHWAFEHPKKQEAPLAADKSWNQNEIDRFVYAKLRERDLVPQEIASPYEQIRRVYLDLAGLPPSTEQVEEFCKVPSNAAYERMVDQLLDSQDYSERWARKWLDLARYADTNGYEKDRNRMIWPYRDWVINAIRMDMPFNQFTIEQLAGDMLPNATIEQRIATGFHRNTMLNEEGGIDPLEFRYYAVADRTATTGTIWLGMTIGCAQCHTHKFDPITHDEYFGIFALLNNADEPELPLPSADFAKRQAETRLQISKLKETLADRFPVPDDRTPLPMNPVKATSLNSHLQIDSDGIVRVRDLAAPKERITVSIQPTAGSFHRMRIEALTDDDLPSKGPGLTPHGNFVITEVRSTFDGKPIVFQSANADFSQAGYSDQKTIDGDPSTGWAIHGKGKWNVNRTLDLEFAQPVLSAGDKLMEVTIEQDFGNNHVLGKFRLSLFPEVDQSEPLERRRETALEEKLQAWISQQASSLSRWHRATPIEANAAIPTLTILDDDSVLASGDFSKSDTYHLKFEDIPAGVTGLRLEAIPDERLPRGGPGSTYYEGPLGDFFLSEVEVRQSGKPLKLLGATHSFANGKNVASHCIDGDKQSGWSIDGNQRKVNVAVFTLEQPTAEAGSIEIDMLCERWYAAGMGRFRWSYTTEKVGSATDLSEDFLEILAETSQNWTKAQSALVKMAFLERTPELAQSHEKIRKLEESLLPTMSTLVMQERPLDNRRTTYKYHRGEFLQPREEIEPHTPSILSKRGDRPTDRLGFAQWLVSPDNPLTARVTVNRAWEAFFGYGLVRTSQDFGYQGDLPTHPELLDYLAVDFVENGWSMKKLHKKIVMSNAYRQSNKITSMAAEKDPDNRWLTRGPRNRLDAEVIRDQALQVSGLLSKKLGGPSVFPAQPKNVATEGTYGAFSWTPSQGEDRYRKSLYTFSKRTTPFALTATFDAPTGEVCIARREITNTPLQALTILNDITFMTAVQEIGKQFGEASGNDRGKMTALFRKLLIRPPTSEELDELEAFLQSQRKRLKDGEIQAAMILGVSESDSKGKAQDPQESDSDNGLIEQAAWALVARVLLNLDEAVTK